MPIGLQHESDNIYRVNVRGRLDKADFERCEERLAGEMRRVGRVRLLFVLEEFEGWEPHANWNDLTVGDLFERMRISMPQNNPGSLSRQQNADILAFMLRKGNYPAGSTDLPTQTEVLNQFKFLAMKPAQ